MAALQLCSQIFNTIELDRYWFQILPTSFEVMDKVVDICGQFLYL